MGTISACIFDLDGVVVDTAKYHYIAWKSIANELGFDFTEEDNERLKGVSRMTSLDILLSIGGVELDQETKLKLADKKNKNYLEYILRMTPDEILPGVKEFMNELKSNGVKIALGSASKNAMTILNQLELTNYFDVVVDGTHVSNAKPDPEVFLKGAELLNVLPSECVVFEDAEAGIEAAINGKMKCVGIGSPDVLGKANIVVPGFVGFSISQLNF
ncbi:beta-phosphoglucomutase [Labilibaculum sp. A4]|uniref:Beta-phosphoglucomutase n=1 Tax=Labilibaculum euxinus TaxID=2686357 RepID=A0A425YEL9_9BACT|nr:beta-phosphoglucomutase [Labilibaculum euxinus]MDQ1771941.1 beta-phosphoglucomutase [Labilibaculum euxinus]MUP39503.1 beta-phosphoglucomutase [Labilibaculum euxinus]MVB08708.1 beta-phosphoglucomutase [Labilibaculum euxinus]MWN75709.1 beta-phosphoglucomutase [Labilibaculum euxinus]